MNLYIVRANSWVSTESKSRAERNGVVGGQVGGASKQLSAARLVVRVRVRVRAVALEVRVVVHAGRGARRRGAVRARAAVVVVGCASEEEKSAPHRTLLPVMLGG